MLYSLYSWERNDITLILYLKKNQKAMLVLVLTVNRNSWIPDSWMNYIVFGYAMICNVEMQTQGWSSLE